MLTLAEIADRDGVSKPTVSIHVKRLTERHGLAVERDRQGRVARVNVAEYDHLRGVTADPSKAQAPVRPVAAAKSASRDDAANESYDEALRQKTWHEAERRRIELDALKKRLVARSDVEAVLAAAAAVITGVIEALPAIADDLAAAVAREGSFGARHRLKQQSIVMLKDIGDALAHATDAFEADEASPEPVAA